MILVNDQLKCPTCGCDCTHVDTVQIAARREDGPVNEIGVNAITGQVKTHMITPAPMGETIGVGRRHRIALIGTCESGCEFAIIFTQHKGATYVETAP